MQVKASTKEGWAVVHALTEVRNHESKVPLFDDRRNFTLRSPLSR